MSSRSVTMRRALIASALLGLLLRAAGAAAQQGNTDARDAGKHFRQGVELYGEADYSGALVEFKRAYALAPNAVVLYNIGEAQYELQDYAGALTTFLRFLVEAAPTEGHRVEVERDVEILRTRVGHLRVTTLPAGAEIAVDDQAVGKTPLGEPLLVSIGRRKVVASLAERPSVTRYVDVAANENVPVTLQIPGPMPYPERPIQASAGAHAQSDSTPGLVGWITTAAFTAGAATFGVLALREASDLKTARDVFPATSATLRHHANLITTYSLIADSLSVAAIVVGAFSLYWTFSSPSSEGDIRTRTAATRVLLSPTSARFEMTF
jgi:hypothetical protein